MGGPISASDPQALVGMLAASEMAMFNAGARDTATEACRGLAGDLGASQEEQDAAEAGPDPGARLQSWCSLALASIATIESKARGGFVVRVTAPTCTPLVESGRICLVMCTQADTCDASTSPATCDGVPADAQCEAPCRIVAATDASCDEPGVEVSWDGPDDAGALDEAKDVIGAHVRTMAILQGQLGIFAGAATVLGGYEFGFEGCDADCLGSVGEALQSATRDFEVCAPVVDEVMRTLSG